jgi:two-component system capsular synthesis sensor histidine kinase RcsC
VTEVLHDLRSPLTSIRCLAELLERGQSGMVTDVQRKQLRLIYSAALGIGSMATDVIEMARQGDQVPDGDRVPFSIAEVMEGVAMMVRPIAEEKGLRMVFQQLPSDQRIGMPHALGRVLLNLVTNALKFTDEGSVEVQVRATTPTRVEFAVVDTGRGIPEAAIPHLFRPFRRSTGRAARAGSGYMFSGTGLGLALCRKLLRAMDSDIRYETTPGVGTRFYFELELPPQLRM